MPVTGGPRAKLLLVDDEAMVTAVFSRGLREAGFEVVVAENGWEGWRQAQNQQFDLIITDHVMPLMNGVQLVKHVRQAYPSLPIILISGNFVDPDTPSGYPQDVVMIYKPFTNDVLLAQVQGLLEK